MSKTLPHHTTNMTTRTASRKKAAKLATPNRFEALAAATEEQKTFDPPTAISKSEDNPSALDHTNLKDDLHILRDSTNQKIRTYRR